MEKEKPNQIPKSTNNQNMLKIKITPPELKLHYLPNQTVSTNLSIINQTNEHRAFTVH